MSNIYNDQQMNLSCIISENRKDKPYIPIDAKQKCPFCLENKELLTPVKLKKEDQKEDVLIRVVGNKYPVSDEKGSCYGVHDVIIDTQVHGKQPKDFSTKHWQLILEVLYERSRQILQDSKIQFIQIFKNNGLKAGASIAHSHWQLVGLEEMPQSMCAHLIKGKEECFFCHRNEEETPYEIVRHKMWTAFAPKVSEFPHETWITLNEHIPQYTLLIDEQVQACAEILQMILQGYGKAFEDLSYNICFISGKVSDLTQHHFYIKIVPRLSNPAGFELATNCFINTVAPLTHAQLMRKVVLK